MTTGRARAFSMVSPTRATRLAAAVVAGTLLLTATYLAWSYAGLPDILPVHFRRNGYPNGWQYKTIARVLMPWFVQLALASVLGAIAALLLSRSHGEHDAAAPDIRAAGTAAEAVALVGTIWVVFQAYAAYALVAMWQRGRGPLGPSYSWITTGAALITAAVAIRAHIKLGTPSARPFVAAHWRLGQLYRNPEDPALFVPTRDGSRWTLNFGRPLAAALIGVVLTIGIVGPAVILGLLLR